ncbi:cytochrome b [Azospirillum sp.]|uniref:cytochrome b n=1 Tax=Azospirillum sp. TaxID=34012 RepID=UPI003D72DC52
MTESVPKTRYDLGMQALHWATALAIVGAFVLIQVVEGLPKGDSRTFMMGLHKSFGVTALALVLVRVAWRHVSPPPALPPMAPWIETTSRFGHVALYALMVAVPVVGMVMSWSGGRPIAVFGLFTLPDLLPPNPALKKGAEEVHEVLGNAILILAGLHAAAALVHQYVLKDGVLARMLPWGAKA